MIQYTLLSLFAGTAASFATNDQPNDAAPGLHRQPFPWLRAAGIRQEEWG